MDVQQSGSNSQEDGDWDSLERFAFEFISFVGPSTSLTRSLS